MKLAAANGRDAVQIFTARIEGQSVIASMEFVPGETLKDYCERTKEIGQRIGVCYVYLDIIERTTTPETRHGEGIEPAMVVVGPLE